MSRRAAVTRALLMQAISHLTERDRALVRWVAYCRVLTADQLTWMFFGSPTTARHRLTRLYQLRLLDRFRPLRPLDRPGGYGSSPYHYVLDEAGALLLAAEDGQDLTGFRWRRRRVGDAIVLARSQQLAHTIGVNGVFAALYGAAARSGGRPRLWWLNEAGCAEHCSPRDSDGLVLHRVRPDGWGRWGQRDRAVSFWLEYDRGTEPLDRLRDKLKGYAWLLARDRGHGDLADEGVPDGDEWVLFTFLTPRREANARRVLAHPGVRVATAVLPPAAPTLQGPLWLPVSAKATAERLPLSALGQPARGLPPDRP